MDFRLQDNLLGNLEKLVSFRWGLIVGNFGSAGDWEFEVLTLMGIKGLKFCSAGDLDDVLYGFLMEYPKDVFLSFNLSVIVLFHSCLFVNSNYVQMHMFINESLDVFVNKNTSVKEKGKQFLYFEEISLYLL